jgi:signal transduction histidine kinase
MRIPKKIVIWLLLLFAYLSSAEGQNRIDSLRSILNTKKVPDSIIVKTSVELCKALVNTYDEFLIPEYAGKGLIADSLNRDMKSKFALYEYLGNYFWRVGKLNEAASQFNQMRMLGESSTDTANIAKSYNGLGTVYYLMEDYSKALEYYRRGLSFSGADSLLKVKIFNNLANIFILQNTMDSVFLYYYKSVTYYQAHQNFGLLASVYTNIALAYKQLRNSLEVRKNINLALEAAIKADDPYRITSVYRTMGILSLEKHPDMAVKFFEKALGIARRSKSYDQILLSLESLSDLADSSKKYKKEIVYLREIRNLVDSLDREQEKARLKEMEAVYLNTRRDIAKLEETRLSELKIIKDDNRQKNFTIILLVAFTAVLILFLMGFYNYRLKMKITRTKERFFAMIAHDIRNPFSGILGLSGLLNDEADKYGDPVHIKRTRSLDHSLNYVYDLLENLLQWSQTETGKIAFNPSIQVLSPFVNEVVCLNTAVAKQKGIKIENQIQTGLTARFDSNMLQTIIRNLLSNSIKFSSENSSIFLSAEVNGTEVVVKVRDEGAGMTQEQIDNIFLTDRGISTTGTRNETGTGLGLLLCKDFIRRHGGKIWTQSQPGFGTTMCFTLPDRARKAIFPFASK